MTHTNFIILGIIVILLLALTIYLFIQREYLSKDIERLVDSNDRLLDISKNKPTLPIDKQLQYTTDLLAFIDSLVEIELINEKRFSLLLGDKDKNLDFDTVIKNISTRVFESFDKRIFVESDNILTSEYLSSYIQKRTIVVYLGYIQQNVSSQL